MQKTQKEIIVYLFVGIVFLLLSYYLWSNSSQYSCDQCIIEFKSSRFLSDYVNEFSIPIQDIHEGLEKGKCIVTWDKVGGFHRHG